MVNAKGLSLPITALAVSLLTLELTAQTTENLLDQTLMLLDKGKVQEAKKTARRAFNGLENPDHPLYGKAAYIYAKTFSESGNFDNASTYFEHAMEFADVRADTSLLADILIAYGLMRVNAEAFADGERNLNKGIEYAEAVDNQKAAAMGLSYVAKSKFLQENYLEGIILFKKCADQALSIANHDLATASLSNVGRSFAEIEEYDSASHYTRQAIQLALAKRNTFYLNICFENLAYYQINTGRIDSVIQSQIEHYETLRRHGFKLDTSGYEPKVYINRELLLLADSLNAVIDSNESSMARLNERIAQKDHSLDTWQFISIPIALLVILFSGFQLLKRRSDQRAFQAAHQHLQHRLEAKIKELETMHNSLHVKEQAELFEAIEKFTGWIRLFQSAKADPDDLWVACLVLRSFGMSYSAIGNCLHRTKGAVGHYFKDMAETIGVSQEEMQKEPIRLGQIIWNVNVKDLLERDRPANAE